MADNFLSPGYGMQSLAGGMGEEPMTAEDDPITVMRSELDALRADLDALKQSLADQGIEVLPMYVDSWRKQAQNSAGSYGEEPYPTGIPSY